MSSGGPDCSNYCEDCNGFSGRKIMNECWPKQSQEDKVACFEHYDLEENGAKFDFNGNGGRSPARKGSLNLKVAPGRVISTYPKRMGD